MGRESGLTIISHNYCQLTTCSILFTTIRFGWKCGKYYQRAFQDLNIEETSRYC
jgi:hypothetical protein